MDPLTNDKIAWAAQIASLLEVCAEKPGNVTLHKDFNDTCFEDFVISAVAIGPAFQRAADAPVGETIIQSIRATRRFVGVNTNLGIVLLLAPLAKAAGLGHSNTLRSALRSVLRNLTVDDTRLTYEAIRLAGPAGMGTVQKYDLQDTDADITLYEAMEQARDRDALAREYVTDFEITFKVGLNALKRILEQGAGMSEAVVQTFLTILTQIPDTLIARKNGMEAARKVSRRAGQVLKYGGIFSEKGKTEIKRFDLDMRDKGHTLNPGTTADLIAAVLFVYLVENDLPRLFQSH
jgi:triphosphoribosyl-dephospho-CoA synthase